MFSATYGNGLRTETVKKFAFTGSQRDMVAWGIITLQKVFPNARRFLVVFMKRRTNAQVCLKY